MLITLYALETVLTFSSPAWVEKLGTTLRKGPTVVSETRKLREQGIPAYPFVQSDTYVQSSPKGIRVDDTTTAIPLSGIPDELTVLCNESGTTIGYRADSLGFRNPGDIWEPIYPEYALVGDSFTQGFCRSEPETIASLLRANQLRVVNAGVTGAGPLTEAGVVREFISKVKPHTVFWLFYEGNDLIDISSESKTDLARYADTAYSQNLIARKTAIARVEKRFADSLIAAHPDPGVVEILRAWITMRKLRTALGLYRIPDPPHEDLGHETSLFKSALASAQRDISGWNGRLVLVYLPERRRFNTNTNISAGENHDPRDVESRIRRICAELNIPFVDVAKAFADSQQPTALWNSRRYHYNPQGYAIVARTILAWIAANPR